LATAQSKDEMKKVLEDTASPLGGWRVKQQRKWLASVSVLVGYQVAYEHTAGAQHNASSTGLIAPVGVDFTSNQFFKKFRIPSFGVLLAPIDLGNLVTARINNTGGVQTTDTSIKQVIAPGFYFHWAIPKSPAVVGLGYSYSPAIRTVEENGVKSEQGTHRILFFLSVDATLFYFRKM
jgi:hypothetical protein